MNVSTLSTIKYIPETNQFIHQLGKRGLAPKPVKLASLRQASSRAGFPREELNKYLGKLDMGDKVFSLSLSRIVPKESKAGERELLFRTEATDLQNARLELIRVKAEQRRESRETKKELVRLNKQLVGLTDLNTFLTNAQVGKHVVRNVPLRDMVKLLLKNTYDRTKLYTLKIANQYFVLHVATLVQLEKIIDDTLVEEKYADSWSSVIVNLATTNVEFELEITNIAKRERLNGRMFRFYNRSGLNLKRYGVYSGLYEFMQNENCLCSAVRLALGETNESGFLFDLTSCVRNGSVVLKNAGEVFRKWGYRGCIRTDSTHSAMEGTRYIGCSAKDAKHVIQLGLVDSHYFLNEQIPYTRYALKHCLELGMVENWGSIYKKRSWGYEHTKTEFMSSFEAIQFLFNNKEKLLSPTEMTTDMLCYAMLERSHEKDNWDLTEPVVGGDYRFARKIVPRIQHCEEKVEPVVVFFDTETTTDGLHVAYLLCCYYTNPEGEVVSKQWVGADCGKEFIDYIYNLNYYNTLCIAHNLAYDFSQIMQYVPITTMIKNGSQVKAITWQINQHRVINFHNSYALIPAPLREFAEMFHLESEKEIMPYGAYNSATVLESSLEIQFAVQHLKCPADEDEFVENIRKWECGLEGGRFDHLKYSKIYCEIDCVVLAQGWSVFRGWLIEATGLDINDYISLPSLVKAYLRKTGCFDGVVEISGMVRKFIQKGVVGGRTMLANNTPSAYVSPDGDTGLTDLDARGLYGSSFVKMQGFLIGAPKLITPEMIKYSMVEEMSGFFAEIRIDSKRFDLDFPLFNELVKGVRNFSNDMVGKTIIIDKVGLSELIEQHGITYTILRGYFFDQGHNTKINDVMKHLIEQRQIKKQEKNPIERIYKLLCNSGYGLLTTKAYEFKRMFFATEAECRHCIEYNSNLVRGFQQVGCNWEVDLYIGTCGFFNYCHIATEVLSVSKKIMNSVMCLADVNGIDIYYQDTDSMHLKLDDVARLEQLYKDKYGVDMLGKGIGEFDVDFKVDDPEQDPLYPVRSVVSLFCAKKVYYDRLKYRVKSGEFRYAIHKRMKGVPELCVDKRANELFGESEFPVEKLYQHMYDGNAVEFNLLDVIPGFQQHPNLTYTTREVFTRRLCFAKKA